MDGGRKDTDMSVYAQPENDPKEEKQKVRN